MRKEERREGRKEKRYPINVIFREGLQIIIRSICLVTYHNSSNTPVNN